MNPTVASTSSATDSYPTLQGSTDPPVQAVLRTSALPPQVGLEDAVSEQVASEIVKKVSTVFSSSTHLDHSVNNHRRQPRRSALDTDIAASVGKAKERTGKSWRWLGKRLGISHSHLLQISQGVRCPSKTVALAMKPLPFEEGEWEELFEAAVVGRGRDR